MFRSAHFFFFPERDRISSAQKKKEVVLVDSHVAIHESKALQTGAELMGATQNMYEGFITGRQVRVHKYVFLNVF
jgi:hypothetical protein